MFSASYMYWGLISAIIFMINGFLTSGRVNPGLIALGGILGWIIGWVFAFIFMPPLDLFLFETNVLIFFLFCLGFFCSLPFQTRYGEPAIPIGMMLVGVIGIWLIWFLSSSEMMHADRFAKLVVPTEATRDTNMPLTDQTQVRLVTSDMARKRAAELIASSDEQGVGSRVEIGAMWGNEINGKFYWAAPLEHSTFFRWMNFDTTPGYIMVSQANELDTKFVQSHKILIGNNSFFDSNIYRRLYTNGYTNFRYGTGVFQIDPEGVPYWVVPLMYPTIGMSAFMPVKWVAINATTGDMTAYNSAEEVPEWIGRVYPQETIVERFNDWGCLSQGWWACNISGQNVIQSTSGISVTIDPKGHIVYYSGTQFQQTKAEGASSGVYIANARTGAMTFYPRAGITEEVAQQVLTQAYSNYRGYTAAEPILISINGNEAYFSIVIDGSGVRKGFALVAQDNRNIVGIGSSVQSAVTEYTRAFQRSSRDSAFEAKHESLSDVVEGLVMTYVPYVQNGKTSFYISIDTHPAKIFEISEEKISDIVVTQVGDPVRLDVENMKPGIVYVTKFDNLRVNIDEDGIQSIVDNTNSAVMKKYQASKQVEGFMSLMGTLKEDELDKMMDMFFTEKSKWKSGG